MHSVNALQISSRHESIFAINHIHRSDNEICAMCRPLAGKALDQLEHRSIDSDQLCINWAFIVQHLPAGIFDILFSNGIHNIQNIWNTNITYYMLGNKVKHEQIKRGETMFVLVWFIKWDRSVQRKAYYENGLPIWMIQLESFAKSDSAYLSPLFWLLREC